MSILVRLKRIFFIRDRSIVRALANIHVYCSFYVPLLCCCFVVCACVCEEGEMSILVRLKSAALFFVRVL
jgi:hypothetical protein